MLNTRQKLSYGICRLGTSTLLNIVTFFTFWVYKDIFEIPAELSGIGNAFGKIAIAFSGFIFGYLSDVIDRSNSKWGRRQIFMWIGSPLLAISFIMLFTPHLFIPVERGMMRFGWLMIWNAMFHLFYGMLLTPYQSWMPEITGEDERINVSAIQNVSNLTGSLVGTGFTFIIASKLNEAFEIKVIDGNQLYTPGGLEGSFGTVLFVAVIAFAVLEAVLFLPALLTIKEKPVVHEKRNVWEEVKVTLKNRNYVIYMISFSIIWVGVIIMTAMMLDFVTELLGFASTVQSLSFAIAMFGAVILGFVFWSYIGNKYGKKKGLIISFIWLVFWMPLTPLIGRITFIPLNVQGYLYGIGAVFGSASAFLYSYAIISDIADKDERDTSRNRSGLYTGFKNIPTNIGQASGYIIAGYLSRIPGNIGLKWLGPIVIGFLIIAFPIFIKGNFDPFLKNNKNQEATIETEKTI